MRPGILKNLIINDNMRYLITIISFFIYAVGYTQTVSESIGGIYVLRNTEPKQHIEIFNNNFLYVATDARSNRLYAEAQFSWLDDDFIELHSNSIKDSLYKEFSIEQSYDIFKSNELHIKLRLPKIYSSNLNINVRYINEKLNGGEWSEFHLICGPTVYFTLPEYTKKFVLSVAIGGRFANPANLSWFSDGNIYYQLPEVIIENNINSIDIKIPWLDQNYFDMYSINGEYVKIEGDKIIWRGQIFEKSHDEQDMRYIKKCEKHRI